MVPVASTPSIITRPPSGSSRPAMMLKMVLLPQPDGPIRLTKRPCGIDERDRRQRLEDAGRRLERHADVVNAKFRGRRRHAHSARQWHDFPQSPGLYRKSHASDHSRLHL
jgi:hypothetical protein